MILKIKTDSKACRYEYYEVSGKISIGYSIVKKVQPDKNKHWHYEFNHPSDNENDKGIVFENTDGNMSWPTAIWFLPEDRDRTEVHLANFELDGKYWNVAFHQAYLMNEQGQTIERYI